VADNPGYAGLIADLEAEEAELDAVLVDATDAQWATPTPAAGWDVRDTVGHLASAEELAGLALTDPAAFGGELERLLADLSVAGNELVARARTRTGPRVLTWWRDARTVTLAGLQDHGPRDRVPWVAGPMSAMSFATARLMETWAHGQDVFDALAIDRVPTGRLRHVAELGVRTRPYAYAARGRERPAGDVRVELTGPDGTEWTWGESSTDFVRGPAVDFCLVVTQRRNPAGTALAVTGPLAAEWIPIAQAFAGPPTDPRPAGSSLPG
jgi:uncharacterized protein (TIGR03084 family)